MRTRLVIRTIADLAVSLFVFARLAVSVAIIGGLIYAAITLATR